VHPAIQSAVAAVLAGDLDQSENFRRQFKTLMENVLTGNYGDSDIRRVMESIQVNPELED
jgi:hypothetical protein